MRSSNVKVLITGGSGLIGQRMVRQLQSRGIRARVLALPQDPRIEAILSLGAEIRQGDVQNAESLKGLCEGIETVYHMAAIILSHNSDLYRAINVRGTENILSEACRCKVSHFVHVSSASVVYQQPTDYSISKRAGEDRVKSSGLNYTIVRPTLVYGSGKGGLEFDLFLESLSKYPFVPMIGNGSALKRPVYVEDLVSGLLALCGRNDCAGKIYNLSGGEAISVRNFVLLCLSLLGSPNKPIVRFPIWWCRIIAHFLKLFMRQPPLTWQAIAGMIQDANLDPSNATKDLGYQPMKITEQLPLCFPRIAYGPRAQ